MDACVALALGSTFAGSSAPQSLHLDDVQTLITAKYLIGATHPQLFAAMPEKNIYRNQICQTFDIRHLEPSNWNLHDQICAK